ENYREFEMPVRNIKSHAMLALRRGESEKIVVIDLKYEEEEILSYIDMKTLFSGNERMSEFYFKLTKDAFSRLMKHSLIGEVRLEKKKEADEESIRVFEENLRQLLLSSPAGRKMTLGIDPGFRTGCKVVVVDNTGKFLENTTIYLLSDGQKAQAEGIILALLKKYDIELIAIGNGTAGRETDDFITITVDKIEKNPVKVLVNEAGASVYSAGKAANEEFPELDLTVRGAISIARRLQDPLAELVKIDPKSIGVGQYQHDVDQKLLKKKLEDTVESCVNFVGVDLNTASKELLTYVSGLSSTVAKNIVAYRNQNGAFANRKDVKKVTMFGAKAFEQAAGFLRIPDGKNVLDNTAVHPESYGIVKQIAADIKISIGEIGKQGEKLKDVDLKKYVTDSVGIPTLRDIIAELMKPGRDPRAEFKYAEFDSTIKEIRDLKVGMILEGVITNITNFGAFTDIGVHQDGLVHISQLANRFVKHPTDVVKVGQIVKVKVTEVNEKLKRIGLSMKECAANS
ncbi:MAG: helix-hairpin-helix domain-containing protein, partial [Chlorobi bacterium]|nr:helix-hairpin-helix domain-containing protein [Chlorobiota bacterium]